MKLEGITPGTNLVTVSGDVVALLEVAADGASAKVRYVEVLNGASIAAGTEDTVYAEDIATVDNNRFIGPGQTASTAGG
jgi:hypothetical protein